MLSIRWKHAIIDASIWLAVFAAGGVAVIFGVPWLRLLVFRYRP